MKNAGNQKLVFRVLTLGWICCVTLDEAGLLLCLQIRRLDWKVSNMPPAPTFIFVVGCCDSVGMLQKEGSADLGLTDQLGQPKEQKEHTPPQPGPGARAIASAVIWPLQLISLPLGIPQSLRACVLVDHVVY